MPAAAEGAKPHSAPIASMQLANIERKKKLSQLVADRYDVYNDPYLVRHRTGVFECKLCTTTHPTIDNFQMHTQARTHQTNLRRRAHLKALESGGMRAVAKKPVQKRRWQKVETPGYQVVKLFDDRTGQSGLLFRLHFPKIKQGERARHRFLSTFEQSKEPYNANYQYIVFAAEPYEIVAFKIPALQLDKANKSRSAGDLANLGAGRLVSHWDKERKVYTVQVLFQATRQQQQYVTDAARRLAHVETTEESSMPRTAAD